MQLLLDRGADINTKNGNGETALFSAATHRHETIVQLLLDRGADIDVKNCNGETALQLAIQKEWLQIVWILLKKGAAIDDEDQGRVLHKAVMWGDDVLVVFLLEKGTDINVKNVEGQSALQVAIAKERRRMIKILVEKGAAIEEEDRRKIRKYLEDNGEEIDDDCSIYSLPSISCT